MMRIHYVVEMNDLRAFWRHYLSTSAQARRQRIVFLVCFAAFFLFLGLRASFRDDSVAPLLSVSLPGAIFLALFWRFSGRVSNRRLRKLYPADENKGVLCEHTLELTDVGVMETSPVGQHSTRWAGIPRVGETATHVFIYIGSNMAHVIPRANVLHGNVDDFMKELKTKMESQPKDGQLSSESALCASSDEVSS